MGAPVRLTGAAATSLCVAVGAAAADLSEKQRESLGKWRRDFVMSFGGAPLVEAAGEVAEGSSAAERRRGERAPRDDGAGAADERGAEQGGGEEVEPEEDREAAPLDVEIE